MRSVRTALIVVLVLLLAAMLPAMVVLAQEGVAAEDSVLKPLLENLFIPGVLGAVVGILLSYVVDWIPGYGKVNAKAKRLMFFGVCLVISAGAGVLIPLIQGHPLAWDPIVGNAIVASLAAMSGGTLAHTRELPA